MDSLVAGKHPFHVSAVPGNAFLGKVRKL